MTKAHSLAHSVAIAHMLEDYLTTVAYQHITQASKGRIESALDEVIDRLYIERDHLVRAEIEGDQL